MSEYEYKLYPLSAVNADNLNALAEDGWDVVAPINDADLILRRPRPFVWEIVSTDRSYDEDFWAERGWEPFAIGGGATHFRRKARK